MLSLKALAGLVLICFAVLSFPPFLNAVGSESSPSQVVQHWIAAYPKDLNTAATLTTARMRDGLSPESWVRTQKAPLANVQLRYLGGEILSEDVSSKEAVVILKAHISTVIGEQVQRERYRVRRIDGQWLIDEVKVVAERFIGQTM